MYCHVIFVVYFDNNINCHEYKHYRDIQKGKDRDKIKCWIKKKQIQKYASGFMCLMFIHVFILLIFSSQQ